MYMYDVNKWQELYTDYQPSKHNVVGLPNKYDINLDEIDSGIKDVLNNFQMIPYTVDSPVGKHVVPGYYGLCFKSTLNSKDPLGQGLSSNVHSHKTIDSPIDIEYTEKSPAWFPYLDEVVSKFKGQVTQIRLIKLEAGHDLLSQEKTAHIDYPWYRGIRMHICITPGADYTWRVLGKDYSFTRSNKMFYLDTGKPHGAVNSHNNNDRYVLNFNLIPHLDNHIDYQIENQII